MGEDFSSSFSGLSSVVEEVFWGGGGSVVCHKTELAFSDLPSVFRATMMMMMMYGSYKHDPN